MERTIVFRSIFPHVQKRFGLEDGGEQFGHQLLYPSILLRRTLEQDGWTILEYSEDHFRKADVAVSIDIHPGIYDEFRRERQRRRNIFMATESVIYAPMSHLLATIADPLWESVLTWNRSFHAPHIIHYDIPVAGSSTVNGPLAAAKCNAKGVAVSRYKNDSKGSTPARDLLFSELARRGDIDLYGGGWRPGPGVCGTVVDKIQCMSGYGYALVCENAVYPGYVTEKLADSIIAGIPALYYGDWENAQRRFPGTFVPLHELSVEAFSSAHEALSARYDEIKSSVMQEREKSDRWCDSYINAMIQALQ